MAGRGGRGVWVLLLTSSLAGCGGSSASREPIGRAGARGCAQGHRLHRF